VTTLTTTERSPVSASWRTDLYAYEGTLLSHAESIELFKDLGVKMTLELKVPSVDMPLQARIPCNNARSR
jgi:glycerophosphoryl diester phosphodiesterase